MTTEPNKPNTTHAAPNEDGLSLEDHYNQARTYALNVDAAVASATNAPTRKDILVPSVVSEAVTETPSLSDGTPILLCWNELKAGDYWAFRVDEIMEENAHLVRVCLNESGKLTIELDGIEHALSDNWDFYQYLPCVRPSRSQVRFQSDI